jgi:hypothetical protein
MTSPFDPTYKSAALASIDAENKRLGGARKAGAASATRRAAGLQSGFDRNPSIMPGTPERIDIKKAKVTKHG